MMIALGAETVRPVHVGVLADLVLSVYPVRCEVEPSDERPSVTGQCVTDLVVLKDVVSLTLGECVSTHMEPPDVVLTIVTSFQIVICALCVFASVASPSAHRQSSDDLPWACASSCTPAALPNVPGTVD